MRRNSIPCDCNSSSCSTSSRSTLQSLSSKSFFRPIESVSSEVDDEEPESNGIIDNSTISVKKSVNEVESFVMLVNLFIYIKYSNYYIDIQTD